MSVETKQRMLGFAFFFLYGVLGFFLFPYFPSTSHFLGPLQHCSSWCSWCYWWSSFWHKQLRVVLCFKKRAQRGSFSPGTPGAVSQQFFWERGWVLLCHIAWGEWQWEDRLLELESARSFQGLMQGHRVLWCFGQCRGGYVNKSCANPWLFMGPLPWAKAAAQVNFDWDIECTAPRPTRHDGSLVAELATCSILGNVVSHKMEAVRCPTAWCPISRLMPSQYSPWLGPSPHSTCSPCVLGSQAVILGHSLS